MVNLLLSVGVLAVGLGLETLAATALFCRIAYAIALALTARGVSDWRQGLGIALRLGVPVMQCAALAVLLGHVFPDRSEMALALGLYVLGISPLTPGMLRGVRQARRLDRARPPLGGPHPEVE